MRSVPSLLSALPLLQEIKRDLHFIPRAVRGLGFAASGAHHQYNLISYNVSRLFRGLSASFQKLTASQCEASPEQHSSYSSVASAVKRIDHSVHYPRTACTWTGVPWSKFGAALTGWFRADSSGVYLFKLYSDDASQLTIAGHAVVNNQGMPRCCDQPTSI